MERVDLGYCCEDCRMAIESDNEDSTPDQDRRTDNGLARLTEWNGLHSIHTGESEGFMHSYCDVCGNLPGERYELFGLK